MSSQEKDKTLKQIRKELYGKDFEWSNDIIAVKKWLNLKRANIEADEDLGDSTLGTGLIYFIDELLGELES